MPRIFTRALREAQGVPEETIATDAGLSVEQVATIIDRAAITA